jgi:hypothetical protein
VVVVVVVVVVAVAVEVVVGVKVVVEELLAIGVTSSLFVHAPKKRRDATDKPKNSL